MNHVPMVLWRIRDELECGDVLMTAMIYGIPQDRRLCGRPAETRYAASGFTSCPLDVVRFSGSVAGVATPE
jgi:hypothetical protein